VETVVHPTARQSDEFLRAHPRARAAAIHETFEDPDIGAVMATVGGDDQLRVLDHLDADVLRANPTRFLGLSDNTNLSLYLWNQGIVSYNGVQLMSEVATPGPVPEYTMEYLRRALFEESLGAVKPADSFLDPAIGWDTPREEYVNADVTYQEADGWTWAGGDEPAAGRVWGGCLAIIRWFLMTDRYMPEPEQLDGAVLALETAEDLPSADRVARLLMCMGERGLLERFDGLVVGRPASQSWLEPRDDEQREAYRRRQRDAIRQQMERYNPEAPIVFEFDYGHTHPCIPLPIGGQAELKPGEKIAFG